LPHCDSTGLPTGVLIVRKRGLMDDPAPPEMPFEEPQVWDLAGSAGEKLLKT